MKKNNCSGFVLAETLIVTVFLMVIFSMIYSNFYPLIGEYEKREVYDDIDSKYSVYWLKRMIEDSSYQPLSTDKTFFSTNRYVRFQCNRVTEENGKREVCKRLVNKLKVDGCDANGMNCNIFITKYCIGNCNDGKDSLKDKYKNSSDFKSGFKDYIMYLPNYNIESLNDAKYRVLASFKHGSYYTYSTIEVSG